LQFPARLSSVYRTLWGRRKKKANRNLYLRRNWKEKGPIGEHNLDRQRECNKGLRSVKKKEKKGIFVR